MKYAFSEITYPDGRRSSRVFRWYGVGQDLTNLIGRAFALGAVVTVRPATSEEVAASESRRLAGVENFSK